MLVSIESDLHKLPLTVAFVFLSFLARLPCRCPASASGHLIPQEETILEDTSPFFPGILASRKPSEPQEKQLVITMGEKNGESTPGTMRDLSTSWLWVKNKYTIGQHTKCEFALSRRFRGGLFFNHFRRKRSRAFAPCVLATFARLR